MERKNMNITIEELKDLLVLCNKNNNEIIGVNLVKTVNLSKISESINLGYDTISENKFSSTADEIKYWKDQYYKLVNDSNFEERNFKLEIRKLSEEIENLKTIIKDLQSDPRVQVSFDSFIEGFKEDVTFEFKKEIEELKEKHDKILSKKMELEEKNKIREEIENSDYSKFSKYKKIK